MARLVPTFGQMPAAPFYVFAWNGVKDLSWIERVDIIVLPCSSRDEAIKVSELAVELLKLKSSTIFTIDQLHGITMVEQEAKLRSDRTGMDWRDFPIKWTLMTRQDAPRLYSAGDSAICEGTEEEAHDAIVDNLFYLFGDEEH